MPLLLGCAPGVDWGVAARAMPGEARSGDRQIVHPVVGGTLLAVADGLGHGAEAADAAARCAAVLIHGDSGHVIPLMRACHETLVGSRGVALSLAVLDVSARSLTWLSVGNVRGILVRADRRVTPAREELLSRGGIVGLHLPPLRASTLSVEAGDMFVMATDGVSVEFISSVDTQSGPAALARTLLERHGGDADDALVLAARLLGPSSDGSSPLAAA
jgi:hypothetical protein